MTMLDKNTFPAELAALPNWVVWRLEPDKNGRMAKVPYNPQKPSYKASSANPDSWGTVDEALFSMDKFIFTGVGFVFTEGCDIIGIDVDHCLDETGKPNDVAAAILKKLPPTYIEISPSNTGLHIFLHGKLPKGGNKNSKTGVEMYAKSRYFTMTGNRYSNCVYIMANDNGVIDFIHTNFITPGRKNKAQTLVLLFPLIMRFAH